MIFTLFFTKLVFRGNYYHLNTPILSKGEFTKFYSN